MKSTDVFLPPTVSFSAEAPTIIAPPEERKVVAEGTSINMTCRVTGKPDPIITWFKDEQQITGGRYQIQPEGDLSIKVGTMMVCFLASSANAQKVHLEPGKCNADGDLPDPDLRAELAHTG